MRINLSNAEQMSLFPPETDDIQESTMQVPIGPYSIFDLVHHTLSEFERAVYIAINEHSNWDTGISRALSHERLAELLGVKKCSISQVRRAVRKLIKTGWLSVEAQRKTDGANIYKITHHHCEPEDVPLDKHHRPMKCAVPRGEGSPTRLLEQGKIKWREMVYWIVLKVHDSDWTTGIVEMTVAQISKLVRFTTKTICAIPKKLAKAGLLKRLSARFRAGIFQLKPKPYKERRERAEYKGPKPLPLIKGWYYSYNKLWRFHQDTLRLMKCEIDGRWREASMSELLEANPKIHKDFQDYMDAASDAVMEAIRHAHVEFAAAKA